MIECTFKVLKGLWIASSWLVAKDPDVFQEGCTRFKNCPEMPCVNDLSSDSSLIYGQKYLTRRQFTGIKSDSKSIFQ